MLVVVAVSLLVVPKAVAEPLSRGCFLTGGGTVDGDSLGGQAGSFRDGSIDGTWTHVTADGHILSGDIDSLDCQKNGGEPAPPAVDFSIARATGTGTWDGAPDYTFSVRVQDHGEPGTRDMYRIGVADEDGEVVYAVGGILDGGNIQIIPTNPGPSVSRCQHHDRRDPRKATHGSVVFGGLAAPARDERFGEFEDRRLTEFGATLSRTSAMAWVVAPGSFSLLGGRPRRRRHQAETREHFKSQAKPTRRALAVLIHDTGPADNPVAETTEGVRR